MPAPPLTAMPPRRHAASVFNIFAFFSSFDTHGRDSLAMGVDESVPDIITCSDENSESHWAGSDMQRAGQKLPCGNKAVLTRSSLQAGNRCRFSFFSV